MDYLDQIKELEIEIHYFDPADYDLPHDKDALYVPDLKLILVNGTLDDITRKNAVLHELGHLLNQHYLLSCNAPGVHFKQEYEADHYMLRYRAKEYLEYFEGEFEFIDITRFLAVYHLASSLYDLAVQVFYELLGLELGY